MLNVKFFRAPAFNFVLLSSSCSRKEDNVARDECAVSCAET